MKAIGYKIPGALDRPDALQDIVLDRPVATGHDLLVEVAAVSVNPVDTKVRASAAPTNDDWKVLGWDAVGKIVEVGPRVEGFAIGDEVFYAGSITRQGANSQFHLVDARIVGRKPKTLSNAEAAALPLTAITAWEMLFDRIDIRRPVPGAANAVLIIGGAGGVGSIAIQLIRALTDLVVIATASRADTQEWIKGLGAHHVLDHGQPLARQIQALGIGAPAFVFSTTHTDQHLDDIQTLIAPQGRFGLIDDPALLDVVGFKRKAVSIHWELMFTRSIFETADMAEQGRLLNEVSRLVDAGRIRTTLTQTLSPINAANLKAAHALIESGRAKGKVVLEGFGPT
ncbi:zinc-binding alcohol dehydrogenase family protein [Caulobacter flavus]|uniref:Zinc-type alcohol dehydrogenase-like protein n=1 Tax=Caulobacter flavus TaxID=1679497 RepID=A0A2N5CWZ2_9CAUL|nr:zinc-binding alcohol dehydrogenase family protein [Caulobacter flavus]AYV47491.1 zinc-binding alcohol dehydrogenase family protein [Caulobacter flavus]PLR18332.1 zinc-binding alcohol dehydrogenase family protein [Caulobacter flavus]